MKLAASAIDKLKRFEAALDPARPEGGEYGARIIGYGEMSTVFTFADEELRGIAFKRMALFHTAAEAERYERDYLEYNALLRGLNIRLPDFGAVRVPGRGERIVLYLSQAMLQSENICNKVIHRVAVPDSLRLFGAVLEKFAGVFRHNENALEDPSLVAAGFDGQLSNWVVEDWDERGALPESIRLAYIDTSTPLMRKEGVEQADPELFLRVCPASLVWMIRLFFLKDVLNRYYDIRMVIIDLIANLYKEKKTELIELFIDVANAFGRENSIGGEFKPIALREVRAYYKEDARIWSLFLRLRRMERSLRLAFGRPYDLILPGNVER